MNKVILIGRVTKDIDLRTTTTDKSITTFTLAVNRDFKNAEGNYDADFITCVAFDQKAEIISRYIHKGDRIAIVGKLNTRTWDKSDGSKGYATEIIVEAFDFIELKKDKPDAPKANVPFDDFVPIDDDYEHPFI